MKKEVLIVLFYLFCLLLIKNTLRECFHFTEIYRKTENGEKPYIDNGSLDLCVGKVVDVRTKQDIIGSSCHAVALEFFLTC